jgi:hypothetical protein
MLDTARTRQRRCRRRRKQGRALLIDSATPAIPLPGGRGSGPGAMVAPAAISAAVVDALIAKREATDRHVVGCAIARAVTQN